MAKIIDALARHQSIGVDTSIFIYHIEGVRRYAQAAAAVFEDMEQGGFEGITSVVALMELLVKPFQLGRTELAAAYETEVSAFPNLTVADTNRAIARTASNLRAVYRVLPADAILLATALEFGATAFMTNDARLRRVRELEVLMLDDFVEDHPHS